MNLNRARAHDQYLLGRHFLERGSADGYGRAVQSLERAVALDPAYTPACAALAAPSFWAADQNPTSYDPKKYMPAAQSAAEKAVALAPDFARGYAPQVRPIPAKGPRRLALCGAAAQDELAGELSA